MMYDLRISVGVAPIETCSMTGPEEIIAGFKSHGLWRQTTVNCRDTESGNSSTKLMGEYEAVRAPETVSTFQRRDRCLSPPGNRTLDRPACFLITVLTTISQFLFI